MKLSKITLNLLAVIAICLGLTTSVWGLDAPQLNRVVSDAGQISLDYSSSQQIAGLNVYRDGSYVTTVRPTAQQGTLSFAGDPGLYCIVAISDSVAGEQYSPCSASVQSVAGAFGGEVNAGVGVPVGLRAEIYSASAAEIFWSAPTDGTLAYSYRLFRDDELVYAGNGKSHFEDSLDSGRSYRYSVSSISSAGEQSDSLEFTLTTGNHNGAGPAQEITDTGPVSDDIATPNNFTGQFYSATVAELFWDPVPGDGIYYELYRDGELLASLDGKSYFEGALQAGSSYQYQVRAVAASGSSSAPATFTLSPTATGSNTGDNPINNADFSIQLNSDRFILPEGNGSGIVVPIQIKRTNNNQADINLTIRPEQGEFSRFLRFGFDHDTVRGESTTNLRMWLDIAAKPLLPQERRYIVSAEQQGSRIERTLYLDVVPIDAPDVYLLIGQSNMEGASERYIKNSNPGGPDERNSRIMQLNVRQNSTDIFDQNWKFSDEQSNVSEPRFIEAEDPLHEPRAPWQGYKEAQFIGPGLSFAKAALAQTSKQIFLVPAAWSASGFCGNDFGDIGWNAYSTDVAGLGGTLLADRALTRLNMTLRDTGGVFRGVLWHQGEADSNNAACAYRYQENLQRLVTRLRDQAIGDRRGGRARGEFSDVPFIVGTMSQGQDPRGDFSQFGELKTVVDTVHRNISMLIPHAAFVNNDDIRPPAYPCGDNSCIHFGGVGYREMGYRFYQALETVWATDGNN